MISQEYISLARLTYLSYFKFEDKPVANYRSNFALRQDLKRFLNIKRLYHDETMNGTCNMNNICSIEIYVNERYTAYNKIHVYVEKNEIIDSLM